MVSALKMGRTSFSKVSPASPIPIAGLRMPNAASSAAATQNYAVPARREDLSGLPPAWIGVGTLDLFLDEDRIYAERLRSVGVDVSYVEMAGGIHAFDLAGTGMGKAFA